MAAVHRVQDLKAVHHRHDDVQQDQRNGGVVLVQHRQTFLPVGGLQNIVITAEDLGQNRAVHLGIVYDQDILAGLPVPPGGRGGGGAGGVLGHNGVFVVLGLIHQPVRAGGCLLAALARAAHHAADAGRDLQAGVAGYNGGVQLLADALQLGNKRRLCNAGQHKQKLIAAVADQMVAFADAAAHDLHGGAQGCIACLMAVGVVVQLEIVKVQHRHAGRLAPAFDDILIIAAVIAAGQGIVVELDVVAGHAAHQLVAVFGVDEIVAVQRLDQFQHTGRAVHLAVDRCDLIQIAAHIFQLGALGMILHHLTGDAVLAGGILMPEFMAGAMPLHRGAAAHLPCVQQPHDRKNRAVLHHFLFDLVSGHSFAAFVS